MDSKEGGVPPPNAPLAPGDLPNPESLLPNPTYLTDRSTKPVYKPSLTLSLPTCLIAVLPVSRVQPNTTITPSIENSFAIPNEPGSKQCGCPSWWFWRDWAMRLPVPLPICVFARTSETILISGSVTGSLTQRWCPYLPNTFMSDLGFFLKNPKV